MSDPKHRHAHSAEQVLDLVPELPAAIRNRLGQFLAERDRSIEDGIDETLRKTVSTKVAGDGGTVSAPYPVWTVLPSTSVFIEKHHKESRFEVTADIGWYVLTGAAVSVNIGVRVQRADGAPVVPVDQRIGFQPWLLNTYGRGSFNDAVGAGLDHGYYELFLLGSTAGGSWQFLADASQHLRVVESLH